MIRTPIKRGQIWEHKVSKIQCRIIGTKGRRWKTITLDKKQENHTLANQTFWTKFELIK